jgi:phi13 family phage major tail protein
MPTYGTGRVLQEARNASVNYTSDDNPLYGDNRIVDDDNGLKGITMTFESTGLSDDDRKALFGEEDYGVSGVSGQWVSDNETPWGGFGYVAKMRDNGVKSYEAWFTLKIKFREDTRATNTLEGSINWGTPTVNGRAAGLYVDESDDMRYQLHKTFETAAAAKNWLKTLANIT